ncbi:MAG TPA: sigma 54-interacting transcriptional regulator [Sandaracinaceae bacterium LLY-WYZ-13_1]|nr:sigma 54-interacting transcriptional regulator [Sandaracinaceae bacterium LLY-WYZ-13_1]
MASDGATTVRPVAAEQVLRPIVFVRPLFEPGRGTQPRPAMPLGRKPFVLGRRVEAAGLELSDPSVSRRHAVLHPTTDGTAATLEDTSSNGTFVDGERVEGTTPVRDGQVIRLGDSFVLVRVASPAPGEDAPIEDLEGRHPGMRELRRRIAAVAPTDAKVLVVGESGTGKELVARAIHDRSGREGRFVAVNCGAIPETLAESQLFGHVAGAFTGAQGAHEGFVRAAHGGTLFLDEVGELSPTIQPKLLRTIEDATVVPVGSTEPVPVDVRLVAATHRDLLAEVDENRFRGDLYARLAGYLIHTLPLRTRREDILPLLTRFLGEGAPPPAPDLVQGLLLHPFRFNVRELKEIATQLRIDGAGCEQLPLSLVAHRLERVSQLPEAAAAPPRDGDRPKPAPPSREEVERLLAEHEGNISRVARALGRSRRQVYRYLEQWGIEP